MTRAEKISVVIPCFNAQRYIGAAVKSVLAQDIDDLEVILVDDGSTDGSAAFVRDNFPTVIVLEQPNGGVAAARNRGIRRATGRWIAFLDADDIWLPGKLRAQLAALQAEPSARLAYSAWYVWSSDESEPPDMAAWPGAGDDPTNWSGPSGWIYPQLLLDCEVWTSTVVIAKELLDEIGHFDAGLRIGEDYDLWLRASRVTPILRVPRPLALYRQHPQSITRSAPLENYRGLVVSRALDRWGYRDDQGQSALPGDVDRVLSDSWTAFAAANLAAGNRSAARIASVKALRKKPIAGAAWKMLIKAALALPRARAS